MRNSFLETSGIFRGVWLGIVQKLRSNLSGEIYELQNLKKL